MFELQPLLDPAFWLNTSPPPLLPGSERMLFSVFAGMLIIGAIIRMVGSKRHEDKHVTETFNRFGRLFVTIGAWGLILFFFTFERVAFFGARFWYLVLGLVFVGWLAMILHYVFRTVPAERSEKKEVSEKEKYLPGKK